MNEGEYREANNRAYYAVYHAISAAHALDGKSYKRHKDTLANFNKDYVKTEVFPKAFGRRIARAEEQILTAKELIEQIETYCLNKLKE